MPLDSNSAAVERILDWVRAHPLPDGRIIPVCVWGNRGVGKCVGAGTRVVVNGRLIEIEQLWREQAQDLRPSPDGEGVNATPRDQLLVPSLDAAGRSVEAPVTGLFRQRVREWGRRITLNDGSELVMTNRHRLRGPNGWQREIAIGDRVGVPSRIDWEGGSVDHDLITLLAWQIAEGDEAGLRPVTQITQNSIAVLKRVRAAAHRWSARSGVTVNGMPIYPGRDGRSARIVLRSRAYRNWLESRGYEWGHTSAAKRLPDFVVAADRDSIRVFLREFFAGEAHVRLDNNSIEISSASEELIAQLQLMLRRFGIWMRTSRSMKSTTNGSGIERPYWTGRISGPSSRTFAAEIGIADAAKQKRLDEISKLATNTNIEGIPFQDLLDEIHDLGKLPKSLIRGRFVENNRKTTTTRHLLPLLERCEAIATGTIEIERTGSKDSWAAVSKRKLVELHADPARLAEFKDSVGELHQRALADVFWAEVVAVEPVLLDGWVYDLEVENTHNYVAAMICTHNTQLIRGYCRNSKIGFRGYHPAHDNSGSDIVGIAYHDKAIDKTLYARPMWLPSENDAITWDKQGIIFIDELNRAPKAVMQGLFELLGEGTLEHSGWKLPREWSFVCAANPPTDSYDVDRLDEAMMDRMLHVAMGFDGVRWSAWAHNTEIHSDIISFQARFPRLMAEATPQLPDELEILTTPRSLEYLARLYEPGMDLELLRLLAHGLIGKAAGDALVEHLRQADKPVSAEEILNGRFRERLQAHIVADRTDLLEASATMLMAALVIYDSSDPRVATQVAPNIALYLGMIDSELAAAVVAQIYQQAPHWVDPIARAMGGKLPLPIAGSG